MLCSTCPHSLHPSVFQTTLGNLYTPVPESIEPCKITPPTENSVLQQHYWHVHTRQCLQWGWTSTVGKCNLMLSAPCCTCAITATGRELLPSEVEWNFKIWITWCRYKLLRPVEDRMQKCTKSMELLLKGRRTKMGPVHVFSWTEWNSASGPVRGCINRPPGVSL